jgi:hypothetical protein
MFKMRSRLLCFLDSEAELHRIYGKPEVSGCSIQRRRGEIKGGDQIREGEVTWRTMGSQREPARLHELRG